MRKAKHLLASLLLVGSMVFPLVTNGEAEAAVLVNETFTGISTPANAWTSGGGGSVACLTAATVSADDSIPACDDGPIDDEGEGVLRLTPAAGFRSGFAIYNTPISTENGLKITFNMYQYGGDGADGISFFLIDGEANPTQAGANGGGLGYSRDVGNPGIVGGYVGIGFDRFGNLSHPDYGSGGTGQEPNSITVRGSEDTDYQYITRTTANGSLDGNTRSDSLRKVKIIISTNNIMSIAVDYGDGNGYQTELSGIDLDATNGENSLPATVKFGFAASTGNQNNTHEISHLLVETNTPSVSVDVSHVGDFVQGEAGQFTLTVANDDAAEATNGDITVTQTLSVGLTPTSASGTGWSCNIADQTVTCTRPGSGANALQPGSSAPAITVTAVVANNASSPLGTTATVNTPDNDSLNAEDTDTVTVLAGSYLDQDGIFNAIEDGAPNDGDGNGDGIPDSEQSTVTSFPNPITGTYAVLETDGCVSNSNVGIVTESSNAVSDADYTYPVGLMDFAVICTNPGGTATVTMYFYGTYNTSNMVVRKYNSTNGAYRTIEDAEIATVTIGGQPALKITYEITDGGGLDEDGLADGTITDPAGPAVLSASITAPGDGDSSAGAPNTGLATNAASAHYLAAIFGVSLIFYGVLAIVRTYKNRATSTS